VAIGADTKNGVASADEVKARPKPQETATADFIKDAEYHAMLKNLDGLRGVYKNAVRHARPQAELDAIKAMADKLDKK
jgi:triphosphoribosyl-dephospho-CoA synthetase